MEAHRRVLKMLILLLCCVMSVILQDGIESSGAGEVTDIITPGLFETFASGGGPDTTSDVDANVGILEDIADQELNGTYIPLVPNSGNMNSMNNTMETELQEMTTKSGETTIFSQIHEVVVTTTTTKETTVLTDKTDEPVTTTSTTSMETSTDTTTHSTTAAPPVTTSRQTTLRTTKRPPPTTTVKPVLTTASTSDYDPLPCSFNAEELECSEELVCFGEGEVDCTTKPDEEEPLEKAPGMLHSTQPEYEDEYEDSSMFSTEPSDLTIRLPAWKKLISMKQRQFSSTTAEENHEEETTSKTAVADETSPPLTITEKESITDSTLRTSDSTVLSSRIPTSNTEKTEVITTSKLQTELPTTYNEDSMYENGSLKTPNSEKNSSPNVGVSAEFPETESSETTTEKIFNSFSIGNVESIEVVESKTRRRRSKRQNKHPVPDSSVLSSSEPLKLSSFSVTKDQKDRKLCRIKGNLLCSPAPTLGLCKGIGRCHAVVEKKEKSTGEKGVENWAIAVIAICATAAAVTISLLIYLVVTSWKKLKVQPQSGVTTLTYVNNATP